MSKFEMLKVFDCQSMPKDVKKDFFDRYEYGNDCYVAYNNENEDGDDNDESLFVKWLKENGMEPSDERVLINHWW